VLPRTVKRPSKITRLISLFPFGHATASRGGNWQQAWSSAQVRAQMTSPGHASKPRLGLLYITDRYANEARAIPAHLRQELPNSSKIGPVPWVWVWRPTMPNILTSLAWL